MNSLFSGPQLAYLVIAIIVFGLAFAGIVWLGRMIRGELGLNAARGGDLGGLAMMEQIPPAMMKEAIARGLVVPSQLAAMSPIERTFLFASLKQKLAPALASAAPQIPKPVAPAEPPPNAPTATLSILDSEKLRVWCPLCGTELQLPAFPPLMAKCTNCGRKSAVRSEEGGRYVVVVSHP